MRCEEVRELVSGWIDGELSGGLMRTVDEHVAGCAACQAYAADLRDLSATVAGLGREPAPPGLERAIRARIAETGARPALRWQGFFQQAAGLAAVCLISVFSTWAVLRPAGEASTAQHDVVAAHVRSLIQDSPIQVPSSDSHTVRPWFSGKVEFAPPVKDLTAEGFPLAGGRLDYVDGHRVATLVYRRGLHTISVFVWPEVKTPVAGAARVNGLNVLSWSKDGMVWWAVSDAAPEELRELRALL